MQRKERKSERWRNVDEMFPDAQVTILKRSRCRLRRDMTESHFSGNLERNQANLLPK